MPVFINYQSFTYRILGLVTETVESYSATEPLDPNNPPLSSITFSNCPTSLLPSLAVTTSTLIAGPH